MRAYGPGIHSRRSSDVAIAGLAGSIFVGTQVLARLSSGSPGLGESLVGTLIAFFLFAVLVAAVGPGQSWFTPSQVSAKRFRKPLLVTASMAFAFIPRLELSSYSGASLGLRTTLGVLVAAVVGRQVSRWLLGTSLLTIVLHRWTHPTTITVTFLGLTLVGLALCARSELNDVHSSLPMASNPLAQDNRGGPHRNMSEHMPGVRPADGFRNTLLVLAAIALSLIAAVSLSGQARHLAWNPTNSGGGGGFGSTGGESSPRERFTSLRAEDRLDLSYKPTRSNQLIMTLFTDQQAPVFLRAQTFDTWTGTTWKNGRIVAFERPVLTGLWLARPSYQTEVANFDKSSSEALGPTDAVRMVVRSEVAFTGYTPVPVEPLAIWNDGPIVQWRTDGTATPKEGPGPSIYAVLHKPTRDAEIDLARTDLLGTTGISTRVRTLAEEITKADVSLTDKATSIRRWVSSNIRYDLRVKKPADGVDPIENILFTTKAGSCTHFATVTAALLRSVGVPTRIATGFVGQTQVRPGQLQVLGKDAHAWAEIPQVDGSWRIFDTTLGAVEVPPPGTNNSLSLWLVGALALALVSTVAMYLVRRTRRSRPSVDQQLWRAIVLIGRSAGIAPMHPLSYRTYTRELDDQLGLGGKLTKLGEQLDQRAFGPTSDQACSPYDAHVLDEARVAAKRLRKLRRRGTGILGEERSNDSGIESNLADDEAKVPTTSH